MTTAEIAAVEVGIHNVLIATDFSHYSNQALNFGLDLTHAYHAKAAIVFVVPGDEFMVAGAEAYAVAKETAHRDLLELQHELRKKFTYIEGKDYQLFLLEGDVAQAILDFASQNKSDLIVLGTHGRSGLGKMLMGSVAERVFRHSPAPVLTLGPHLHRRAKAGAPRSILVPVDFTPASERAAHYAVALATQHDATLTMLHVIERWPTKGQSDHEHVTQELRDKLEGLISHEAKRMRCSFRIEVGQVVEKVLYTAGAVEADLVVMGVRPRIGLLNPLMWPHAYQIVCEAGCPVLTVRGEVAQRS
jgi:nucleotide-binding universal stress UspA family protein